MAVFLNTVTFYRILRVLFRDFWRIELLFKTYRTLLNGSSFEIRTDGGENLTETNRKGSEYTEYPQEALDFWSENAFPNIRKNFTHNRHITRDDGVKWPLVF